MADYSKFDALNVQILGISSNLSFSQKTFADSLKLPYPLLSDFPDLKAIRSYGGLNTQWDMTTAQRYFFLIDQQGIVRGKWPSSGACRQPQPLSAHRSPRQSRRS